MPTDAQELLLLRFLRELPRLASAGDLGLVTSAVEPWPHQVRLVRRVVERFPHSYLLCDEVGLGKTIEAVLALRQLWLSGRVRRALILVPRAVLRQWHEELHEKAALPVALFDQDAFWDVRGERLEAARQEENPWSRHDLVLASSQLARARGRRDPLLAAEAWDLVVVDEAHHARRRQFSGPFRPNRLLELLAGSADGEPGLASRARCLYLLTATPMQIHPLEIWDLLRLLGLGGRWAAREEAFLDFFEQLRRPFGQRNWALLLDLASEIGDRLLGGRGVGTGQLGNSGPPPAAHSLLAAHGGAGSLAEVAAALDDEGRQSVDRWLRRSTPISLFVWRHTRTLLRRYRDLGLLDAGVPERRPRNVWIELEPRQRRLYRRIESYLAEFHQRYEARRPGLGFVMTVFRRRLTSSFRAVRVSLERRRRRLVGGDPEPRDLELRDLEADFEGGYQQQLELDGEVASLPAPSAWSRDEIHHLDAILAELAELSTEPKLVRLEADLRRLLRRRDRVLIFTQYLDTLDELRDALRPSWRVACYSGRGGEVWGGEVWRLEPKEKLKDDFGTGQIEILLCTEAASEGLNLQTCGVLINYDMPWNPMRVEQRIGRIDRIGQEHPRVWIRNYFYADTVEATVYQRLAGRIDWFRDVVGELQPILHRVGETVESLAMTPESRRRRKLEQSLADLGRRLHDLPPRVLEIEEQAPVAEAPLAAPVTPTEIESLITGSRTFGEHFMAEEPGIYRLSWRGEVHRVTFEPRLFGDHPYSLTLLTWGTPLFDALLDSLPEPAVEAEPAGLGLYASRNPAPVSVFAAPIDGEMREVTDLQALGRVLEAPGRWSADQEARAASLFSKRRRRVLRGLEDVEAARRRAERKALRAAAGELLATAATLELVGAENPGLFDQPPGYSWGEEAIQAQGRRPGPWAGLLEIVAAGLSVQAHDPKVVELRGRSPAFLAERAAELELQARRLIERWSVLGVAEEAARRVVTDVGAGLLERTYFKLAELPSGDMPWADAEAIEPFTDAVPLWPDIASAARELTEALQEGAQPLAAAAENPASYRWVRLAGRVAPAPDLFAAPLVGRALEPRYQDGTLAVFRLDPSPPRAGQLVLIDGVTDPETGDAAVVRRWQLEKPRRPGGTMRLRLEALAPDVAPILIEDPSEETLRVVARLIDVVGS